MSTVTTHTNGNHSGALDGPLLQKVSSRFNLGNDITMADGGPMGHVYAVWRISQHGTELTRWAGWCEEFRELRKQAILEHVYSFTHLLDITAGRMNAIGCRLDRETLQRAGRVHDFSEPILQRDIRATKKDPRHDYEEYLKFKEWHEGLGESNWPEFQKAFLLQTCHSDNPHFGLEEREIMAQLRTSHPFEGKFFSALEWLDYLFSAYEGTYERGVIEMTPAVASRYAERLDKVVAGWPQFGQAIWTPEMSHFFNEAAKVFKGMNIDIPRRQFLFEGFEIHF